MDFSKISLEEAFQLGTSVFEIALLDPRLQISGAVCIIDMSDFTVYQQAKLATPKCAWQISNCIQVGGFCFYFVDPPFKKNVQTE